MTELSTYTRFQTKEEAEKFADALQHAGISSKVEVEKNILDKILVGETLDLLFAVKMASQDFEKAKTVEESIAEKELENINADYYLFSFSNAELIDVVTNKDEWNGFDIALAKKLLRENKVVYNAVDAVTKKPTYKPLRVEPIWIFVEYLLTVYFTMAGIVIGVSTFYAYKTLSNGERIGIYDDYTRNHAKLITVIGIIRIILFLYLIKSR
jgi:hypothetical protein